MEGIRGADSGSLWLLGKGEARGNGLEWEGSGCGESYDLILLQIRLEEGEMNGYLVSFPRLGAGEEGTEVGGGA